MKFRRAILTLIVTAGNAEKIIQVSDRRVTFKSGRKYPYDPDKFNKSIVLSTDSIRCALSISGAAIINKEIIPDLVSDLIAENFQPVMSYQETRAAFITVSKELGAKFRSFNVYEHSLLKTSISVAGYLQSGPVIFLNITNFEDKSGAAGPWRNEFDVFVSVRDREDKAISRRPFVSVHGASADLFATRFSSEIWELRRIYSKLPWAQVAERIVRLIRKCADLSESKGEVGHNCMAVATAYNEPENQCMYFSNEDEDMLFAPNFIVCSKNWGTQIFGGLEACLRPGTPICLGYSRSNTLVSQGGS